MFHTCVTIFSQILPFWLLFRSLAAAYVLFGYFLLIRRILSSVPKCMIAIGQF